jgi:hypothetical protein
MGVPNSPVRHRTGTVRCPVPRHVTQLLDFGAKSTVGALSSCGTGQSDAPLTCCSDFCCNTIAAWFTWQSRPLHADSHCPLAHRTVLWHNGQSGELYRSVPAFSRDPALISTKLIHQL